MKEIVIELPIALPTWNRLLAANPWERKKIRDMIHAVVSMSIQHGKDFPILMEFRQKLLSTESFMRDYYRMIRPSTSRKSRSASKSFLLENERPLPTDWTRITITWPDPTTKESHDTDQKHRI